MRLIWENYWNLWHPALDRQSWDSRILFQILEYKMLVFQIDYQHVMEELYYYSWVPYRVSNMIWPPSISGTMRAYSQAEYVVGNNSSNCDPGKITSRFGQRVRARRSIKQKKIKSSVSRQIDSPYSRFIFASESDFALSFSLFKSSLLIVDCLVFIYCLLLPFHNSGCKRSTVLVVTMKVTTKWPPIHGQSSCSGIQRSSGFRSELCHREIGCAKNTQVS